MAIRVTLQDGSERSIPGKGLSSRDDQLWVEQEEGGVFTVFASGRWSVAQLTPHDDTDLHSLFTEESQPSMS